MRKVFISYSSKDRDVARALAAALEGTSVDGQPLSVWWDRALVAGDDYWRVIAEHLEAADAAIVLWSDTALLSDWVYAEACRAKNARKVVPVSIVGRLGERPPMPFDVLHTVKLADAVAALPEILDGISARIARKPWRTAPGRNARELDVEVLEAKRDPMPVAAYLGPGDLLKAKNQHEVIWFDDVHGLAAEFVSWARRPASAAQGRSALGRLVHAPGGFGKTRLMIEVVDRLQREGWLAGFVPRGLVGSPRQAVLERLIDGGEDAAGLLLVVDYVEQRTAETAWLAERLDQRSGPERRPARLVMLARGAGDTWWPDWLDKTSTLQRLLDAGGPTIPGKGRPYDVIRVPNDLRPSDRAAMFDAAYQAFVQHRPPDREPAPYSERLERLIETDARYDRPLALQMAALLTAWGYDPAAGGSDISDLLSKIVGLEREHWDRVSKLGDGDRNAREALGRAVALATLAQGIGGREAALDLLARDARLAQMKDIDAPRLHDMAAKLYPREDGGIGALEPDLLGEHLVAQVLDDALCDLALDAAGEDQEARRNVLTVLNRATRAEHGMTGDRAARQLERVISQRGETLAVDLMRVGTSTPGRLLELLPRLREVLPRLSVERLAELMDALPEKSLALMQFSLEVTRTLAEVLSEIGTKGGRIGSGGASSLDRELLGQLAGTLSNLGVRLGDTGQHAAALATTHEALRLTRTLVADVPHAFTADLALVLNNMGLRLANVGQPAAALDATREAVDLARALVAQAPDAFMGDLVRSLGNLSNQLDALGEATEALAASQEAVALLRALVTTAPEAHLPDLALSLFNLGRRLQDAGQTATALAATQEAVALYRGLAGAVPDAFSPRLAMSLVGLGRLLAATSQHANGLAVTEEAVALNRTLVAGAPEAFAADLASSLINLGDRLADIDRRGEAVGATQEAVSLYRRLADATPNAFTLRLVSSLNRLGIQLAASGQHAAALSVTEEAVSICRTLVGADPEVHFAHLAESLDCLGNRLADNDRKADAMAATREAIAQYRALVAVAPETFNPNLAASLNALGNQLSDSGQIAAALAATEEAVFLCRALYASAPDAFSHSLAGYLYNLSNRLAGTGQFDAALAAAREAVALRRELAATKTDAFTADLAVSLNDLGLFLAETGQWAAALAATEEAAGLYRQLAAAASDDFNAGLAMCLFNLGDQLAAVKRDADALAAAQEAVALWREVAAATPETYTPNLARSLSGAADRLVESGRAGEAAVAADEALRLLLPFLEQAPAAWVKWGRDILKSVETCGAAAGQVVDAELVARAMCALSTLDTAPTADHTDSGTAAT